MPNDGQRIEEEPSQSGADPRSLLEAELAQLLQRASPALLAFLWRGLVPKLPEPLTARLHAEQLAEALIDLAAAPRCATGEPLPQPGAAAASTE